MQRNLPHTLPDDLVRTWNAALVSSKATVSRVGSELSRQSTMARERFDALPSPYRTAILSGILGGAGQMSIGQTKKGAAIIVVAVLGLIAYVVPGLVVIVLGVYDAYVIGGRFQTHGKVGEWEFFWHPAAGASWKVMRVEPLGLSEAFLSPETLRIDNRQGQSAVNRSLTIRKEWRQSYIIEHEKAQTTTSQFEPTVTKSSMVKRSVEHTYREKYAYSESRMQMLEESVNIEVPAHASVLVELHWKHILDNWTLVVGNDLGEEVRVPVHVVTKLSFDQRIMDADMSATTIV